MLPLLNLYLNFFWTNEWTDMPMRRHLLVISFVIFYQKIPNISVQVPNNTDGMKRIYYYLLFSAPKKWPLVHPD